MSEENNVSGSIQNGCDQGKMTFSKAREKDAAVIEMQISKSEQEHSSLSCFACFCFKCCRMQKYSPIDSEFEIVSSTWCYGTVIYIHIVLPRNTFFFSMIIADHDTSILLA